MLEFCLSVFIQAHRNSYPAKHLCEPLGPLANAIQGINANNLRSAPHFLWHRVCKGSASAPCTF